MENKLVNFAMPNPYQADMAELARRQRMAEMLQQQAAEPVQKFGYGGIEVPISPLAGLAKALNAYSGKQMERDVIKEQKELGERYRADQASDMQTLVEALKPRESKPADVMPEATLGGGPVRPAMSAKPAGALEPAIFGSDVLKTPEMRNFAFQQYLAQQMPKQPKWEKADIPQSDGSVKHGYVDVNASNPVATFIAGGVKPAGVHFANVGNAIVPINQATGQPLQNVSPLQINTSPDAQAQLAQTRELADRAFNNLSAAQKLQASQEAQRIGISLSDYNLRKFQVENPALHIVQSGEGFAAVNPRNAIAQPVMVQGAAGGGAPTPLAGPAKAPTEDQAKAAGYANRMLQANAVLEKLNFEPSRAGNIIAAIPGANPILSTQRQQVEQAQRNFINAVLRRESGATIQPHEFESAAKQYFPQVGDKPEVLEQKRQNRALAIEGLQQSAGASYKPYVPPSVSGSETSGQWSVKR